MSLAVTGTFDTGTNNTHFSTMKVSKVILCDCQCVLGEKGKTTAPTTGARKYPQDRFAEGTHMSRRRSGGRGRRTDHTDGGTNCKHRRAKSIDKLSQT